MNIFNIKSWYYFLRNVVFSLFCFLAGLLVGLGIVKVDALTNFQTYYDETYTSCSQADFDTKGFLDEVTEALEETGYEYILNVSFKSQKADGTGLCVSVIEGIYLHNNIPTITAYKNTDGSIYYTNIKGPYYRLKDSNGNISFNLNETQTSEIISLIKNENFLNNPVSATYSYRSLSGALSNGYYTYRIPYSKSFKITNLYTDERIKINDVVYNPGEEILALNELNKTYEPTLSGKNVKSFDMYWDNSLGLIDFDFDINVESKTEKIAYIKNIRYYGLVNENGIRNWEDMDMDATLMKYTAEKIKTNGYVTGYTGHMNANIEMYEDVRISFEIENGDDVKVSIKTTEWITDDDVLLNTLGLDYFRKENKNEYKYIVFTSPEDYVYDYIYLETPEPTVYLQSFFLTNGQYFETMKLSTLNNINWYKAYYTLGTKSNRGIWVNNQANTRFNVYFNKNLYFSYGVSDEVENIPFIGYNGTDGTGISPPEDNPANNITDGMTTAEDLFIILDDFIDDTQETSKKVTELFNAFFYRAPQSIQVIAISIYILINLLCIARLGGFKVD